MSEMSYRMKFLLQPVVQHLKVFPEIEILQNLQIWKLDIPLHFRG